MIARVAARLVEFSRRRAGWVAAAGAVVCALLGVYTARHVSIDTDENKLISPNLGWRRTAADLDREFPQNKDLLVVVIDAATPDLAGDAAAALTAELRSKPGLFSDVRQPDATLFFRRNGLLFLPRADVQKFADDMISAQPLLGTLAADPHLTGVFGALDLMALGALHGDLGPAAIDRPLDAVAASVEAAADGRYAPLSWQTLLTSRKAMPRELRRFVLARPVLDFKAVEPGHDAIESLRAAARRAGLTPERGVRARVTGPVALSDDQLSTLSEGAGFSTALSLGLLLLWLVLGLRSLRAVAAVLATLLAGLICCAAFAVAAVGPFNPISVAFAPLFIGIAIDFGIQFSVRFSAEKPHAPSVGEALRRTALGIGGALTVAAAATAVGFLSFVPTDYTGVSDLGIIAGVGMVIALALNLTLLPALLTLLGGSARVHAGSSPWAAGADRFLLRRRSAVLLGSAALALAAAALLPRLRFDFNPLNLQNQHSESVATLFDLMADPETTPYTIDVLATPEAAPGLAARLAQLPEAAQVLSLASFVPEDQAAKLDLLRDAQALLAPTLEPASVAGAPSPHGVLEAAARCSARMEKLAERGDRSAARFVAAVRHALSKGEPVVAQLDANLAAGARQRLEDLRLSLQAGPVTVATMPAEMTADWVGTDGRWRIEVFPKGDARDNAVLRRFSDAVRGVAPDATGTPVTIQESARTVTGAFASAGLLALGAISILLLAVLRRVRDVAMVLAPLLLAGLLTLATAIAVGLPLNFANIITLPLLLGIGVAFDIYFVMRWRAGEPRPLESSTARAVVFSALTTGTAFGSLALSRSPGMADMGKLLSLALFFTLACTLVVLPALLGPVPSRPSPPPP